MADADRIYSWTSSRNDAGVGHAPMVRQIRIEQEDGKRPETITLWHLDIDMGAGTWQPAFVEPLQRQTYADGSALATFAIRDGRTGEQLDAFTIAELPDEQPVPAGIAEIVKSNPEKTLTECLYMAHPDLQSRPREYIAPVETGEPWRSAAEADWDESRGE